MRKTSFLWFKRTKLLQYREVIPLPTILPNLISQVIKCESVLLLSRNKNDHPYVTVGTPFVSELHLPWYILIRTQIKKVLYESDLPYGYQDEK